MPYTLTRSPQKLGLLPSAGRRWKRKVRCDSAESVQRSRNHNRCLPRKPRN